MSIVGRMLMVRYHRRLWHQQWMKCSWATTYRWGFSYRRTGSMWCLFLKWTAHRNLNWTQNCISVAFKIAFKTHFASAVPTGKPQRPDVGTLKRTKYGYGCDLLIVFCFLVIRTKIGKVHTAVGYSSRFNFSHTWRQFQTWALCRSESELTFKTLAYYEVLKVNSSLVMSKHRFLFNDHHSILFVYLTCD